jgi:hypothetical protein
VAVQWNPQGGGSVSKTSVTTGSDGRATVQRVLGPDLGQQTTTATVGGFTGSPVTFVATAVPPGQAALAITTQPPASALDAEVFDPASQPVITVRDEQGNPESGVIVTATVASGGGTLQGTATATTDATGIATFGDLGIHGSGAQTLQFAAGGGTVTSSQISLSALSPEATTGAWGPLVKWNIVPLHMALMPNGNIFAWGKYEQGGTVMGMPRIWNPSAGSPADAPVVTIDTMLFCAGLNLMPDGRLMTSGGHKADDEGIRVTNFFSQDGAWEKGPDMHHGRWYPTVTVLPDKRVLTMSGRDETEKLVTIPEIWENGRWSELTGAGQLDIPYYPRNFVAPDGRIFYAGERIESRWFDVNGTGIGGGRGSWSDGPSHIWKFNRDYGTAAMYEAGKILYVGGGGNPGWSLHQTADPSAPTPTETAEKIDINQPLPQWQGTGSMAVPRRHLNSTILPDGTVLVTGGTRGRGFADINPADATRAAEVWDPKTDRWTTLASASTMRIYHSVSLLLTDGTVLHGASGDALTPQDAGPSVPVPNEDNHEIFSPPYLFKGARPVITSAPASTNYGAVVSVATPNHAQITDVRWIRLGAVTHAFDAGQRANTLSFVQTATGVDVTIPASPNLAPPGYYQLFILNRNGVPSEGHVINIQ